MSAPQCVASKGPGTSGCTDNDDCNGAGTAGPPSCREGNTGSPHRAGPGPGSRWGVRRVPDRPAYSGRRTCGPHAASHSGTRDCGHGGRVRRSHAAVRSLATGSAFRGSVTRAVSAAIAKRPRKSVRQRALYRIHDQWRIRGVRSRRRTILFLSAGIYDDVSAAPLLCAGLIGFRSYRMIHRNAREIGIYGFGAAAHIITQIALFQRKRVYAFSRPGDSETQGFALRLGASWAGDSTAIPPSQLDAAILFAPAGQLCRLR